MKTPKEFLNLEKYKYFKSSLSNDLMTSLFAFAEDFASQSKWISVEDAKKIFEAGREKEYKLDKSGIDTGYYQKWNTFEYWWEANKTSFLKSK